ncbi:hypothetical protein [Novosphingobium huizhouense]|uniref:hypothetical protein n=1 Tax=Novosphingobium huizhouense TaxID=2866625 RepID=UPI001CD8AD97|nr:hypothetical protein [Novosphingobium huizhouense]
MGEDRKLTDADVSAVVSKLKEEIARELFAEAGKGLWTWLKKTLAWAVLALALYQLSGGRMPIDVPHVVK